MPGDLIQSDSGSSTLASAGRITRRWRHECRSVSVLLFFSQWKCRSEGQNLFMANRIGAYAIRAHLLKLGFVKRA